MEEEEEEAAAARRRRRRRRSSGSSSSSPASLIDLTTGDEGEQEDTKRSRINPAESLLIDLTAAPVAVAGGAKSHVAPRKEAEEQEEDCVAEKEEVWLSINEGFADKRESSLIYLKTFLDAIDSLEPFGALWTPREVKQVKALLELPEIAVAILLKLADRHSLWQRADKLLRMWEVRYGPEGSSSIGAADEEVAQEEGDVEDALGESEKGDLLPLLQPQERFEKVLESLQQLFDGGFITPFTSMSQNDLGQLLRSFCFTGDELRSFRAKFKERSGRSDRESVVRDLLRAYQQKPVYSNWLASSSESQAHRHILLGHMMTHIRTGLTKLDLTVPPDKSSDLLLFRLCPGPRLLIRRIQRLAHCVAGSVRSSSGYSVGIEDSISKGSLLQSFGKVQYPSYAVSVTDGRHIFESRREFLLYEAAQEAGSLMGKLMQQRAKPADSATQSRAVSEVVAQLSALGVSLHDVENDWTPLEKLVRSAWHALAQLHDVHLFSDEQLNSDFLKYVEPQASRTLRSGRPVYWQQLSAGCILTTALWDYIVYVRKKENGAQYVRSSALLKQLLVTGFTPHRREAYWDHLRIDIGHLQQEALKLEGSYKTEMRDLRVDVCALALQDPSVRGGGRIKLQAAGNAGVQSLDGAYGCGDIALVTNKYIRRLNAALCNEGGEETVEGLAIVKGGKLSGRQKGKALYVGFDDNWTGVEDLVMQHAYYNGLVTGAGDLPPRAAEGHWRGWRDECRALRFLVPLLLWEEVFAPVPDVFVCPWQNSPLDLDFGVQFFKSREELLSQRLDGISKATKGSLIEMVAQSCEKYCGQAARWLAWRDLSVRQLQLIAAGLGGRALAAILTAHIVNARCFGSGMPDLLMLRLSFIQRDSRSIDAIWQELLPPPPTPSGACSDAEEGEALLQCDMGREGHVWNPLIDPEAAALVPKDLSNVKVETMLVEVKSLNDTLRPNQKAWLRVLRAAGVSAFICKVK
jgi:hypothetical protein